MTTKDQAIAKATLELKLVSVTGYECETTYEAVTPEQWGDVVRVLEGLAQPPAPDCRTCRQFYWSQFKEGYRCHFINDGNACTNGDQYKQAPAVVLWRTE